MSEKPQNSICNPQLAFGSIYDGRRSPADLGRRLLRLLSEEKTLYIMCSPGFGYGLDALLKTELPSQSLLLVFEAEPLLFDFFQGSGCEDLLALPEGQEYSHSLPEQLETWKLIRTSLEQRKNIFFCPHLASDSQREWLSQILETPGSQRRVRTLRIVRTPADAERQYKALESDATELLRLRWRNHSTAMFLAPLWVRNIFANLADVSDFPHIDSLQDLIDGRSVMLCGAGTSLDALDHQWLVQEQKQGLVVAAVDTAVAPLLARGIIPDVVCVLEGQWANMDDFVCNAGFEKLNAHGSLIIHDLSAHYPTVRHFKHRMLYCSRFAHMQFLDELPGNVPFIPPLGSVGVAALYIFLAFSKCPIMLAGFDFAFPRGKSHASAAPHQQRILRESQRLQSIGAYTLPDTRHIPIEGQNISHRRVASNGDEYVVMTEQLQSDAVLQGYFERFCEVLRRYAGDRVQIAQHRGLKYAPKIQEIIRKKQTTAFNSVAAETAKQLQPIDYPRYIREAEEDIRIIRDELSTLLRTTGIKNSSVETSQWLQCKELLERRDFLWRFLPGCTEIQLSHAFLGQLAPSLSYWQRQLRILCLTAAKRMHGEGPSAIN